MEMEQKLVEDLSLLRCYNVIISCLEVLESPLLSTNGTVNKEDVPNWNSLFGEKESVLGGISKIVGLQKTMLDLKQRLSEQENAAESADVTQEDWQLLALCVDRWRERQKSEVQAED